MKYRKRLDTKKTTIDNIDEKSDHTHTTNFVLGAAEDSNLNSQVSLGILKSEILPENIDWSNIADNVFMPSKIVNRTDRQSVLMKIKMLDSIKKKQT